MPYTKTVTITEEQDMFLQSNLQEFRNTSWSQMAEQTSAVALSILDLIESAPEANVT